jgi:hypothetical protein
MHKFVLARHLGHGHALEMATWGKTNSAQAMPGTLQRCWSGLWKATVASKCRGSSSEPSSRRKLHTVFCTAVQKTACNLARKELTCMTGSIGVDIAMVVDEVRRLRTDLQSAQARAEDAITQLAASHARLSGANSFTI